MTNYRKKRFIKNIVFSGISKVIMLILGIIIPRLIILNYGSEANGLLSSVGDILGYIALIEAGIGMAAEQALYKSLSEHDEAGTSRILVSTQNYFRKMVKWYILLMLVFSFIYSLTVKTTFSSYVVFGVIFVQGISSALTYFFSSTLTVLLSSDGREYISRIVSVLIFVLNSVLKIVLLSLRVNLILIQCGYLLVNVIQIIIIRWYIHKKYPWLNWQAPPAHDALVKKNMYMLNGVAWTVFSSTDTILLTLFCGLAVTSIYSVYNLVYASLNTVVIIFYSSTYFLLGQIFHESKEDFLKMYDGIEILLTTLTFALFSVAFVMITPFVSLYTSGADIQYIDKWLPLLFALVQIISNARLLSGHVINIHNQPQLINRDSIIEAAINIIVSIVLVWWIGLYGVLIGTIVALLYKAFRVIYVSNRTLLNRSPWKVYRLYLVNFMLFIAVVLFNRFIHPFVASYWEFALYGAIYTVVLLILFFVVNLAIEPNLLKMIKAFIKKKVS